MALAIIEFYQYTARGETQSSPHIYGRLISSIEDASLSTTVEHFAIPATADYYTINTDTDLYIEVGAGNQDVTAGRRSWIRASLVGGRTYNVCGGENTVSYRTLV